MGGFSLYIDQKLVRTLQIEELEALESDGKIDWPTITVEEINDKSKGDYFSKAVVVLQTIWFVTQCIARAVQHIALAQLEVATLAFSAVTIIAYFLWWNKPLDIGVAAKVHLKQGFSLKDTFTEQEWEKVMSSAQAPPPLKEGEEGSHLLPSQSNVQPDFEGISPQEVSMISIEAETSPETDGEHADIPNNEDPLQGQAQQDTSRSLDANVVVPQVNCSIPSSIHPSADWNKAC